MVKNRKVVEFLKVNENKLLIVCLLTLLLYAIVGLFIKNGVVLIFCYFIIYTGLSKLYDKLLKSYCRKRGLE